jgi:rhamnosyltransferase
MKASIIILSKNGQAFIQRCLDKVCNQNYEHDYEVIVIDSGSTDKTLEIIRKYPLRLYEIASDDFRHSKTRNLGASFAKGEFVVYLSRCRAT